MSLTFALPLAVAALYLPAREDPLTAEAEAEVRAILAATDTPDFKRLAPLGGLDPPALPLYARIIKDDREKKTVVAATLLVLGQMGKKVDPGRFLEPAVARLADPDYLVRVYAVRLLRYIGDPRDAPPVVALLWDEQGETVYAAAETLAAIGDRRTVNALDIWLGPGDPFRGSTLPTKVSLRRHVAKCRKDLIARLEKEEAAKKPAK